ncbi:MAG: histidine kinase dimerization/phospho-acceptor domain-containing protein, partial [Halobacteria archaeon]|nr:histidine kinase dimerization/phospho-acceptor domain-containing protein [Halobacteria archaeon]
IVLDPDDTIVDINQKAIEMVGDEDDDGDTKRYIGKSLDELFSGHSEVVEHYRGVIERVNDEIVIEDDGDKRYYDLNISPIYSGNRHAGRIVLLRDITVRKTNEEELKEKNEELERQNQQLDQFAEVVSHDLRNPINIVEGYLPMARDGDDEAFEAIDESIDRMKEIIDDVLMLAREGKTVTETEEVLIDEVAREAWG